MDNLQYDRYLRVLRAFFSDRERAGNVILNATVDEEQEITTYLCMLLADGMGSLSSSFASTDPLEGDLALPIPTFDSETVEQIERGMAPWDAAMFFSIWEQMEAILYTVAHV